MAFDRLFQCVAQSVGIGDVVFDVVIVEPVALVVFADFTVLAPQVAARREFLNATADRHQRLHLRSDIQVAVFIVPHIQRDDAEVVTANQVSVFFRVV
ncbi:hypothetical protein D3C75_1149060 [compost metagenome]